MKFTTWPTGGTIRILDKIPDFGSHLVTSRQSSHEVHQAHECPVCSALPHLRQEPRVRVTAIELVPVRVHKQPRWDKNGTYHRRIQRKWLKRWGYRSSGEPVVLSLSAKLARSVNHYDLEAGVSYETFLRTEGEDNGG